jgi:soluble lytic murein transglycosylase-like protein
VTYSAIALALGSVAHTATLTTVPTRFVPLRTIATVVARYAPTPSPSLSPWPPARVRVLARVGAQASGLDTTLVFAVIMGESAGDPHAVSRAGAIGMMQLMPETAHDCGIQSRWIPSDNVRCGSRTLAQLIRRFGLTVALACYNAGATTIRRAGATHLSRWPSETKTYVRVVVERYDALQH